MGMAITTKVTYSLTPGTVERVQELAELWNCPKSEVVRRAVDKIALDHPVAKKETPLEIFLRIQREGTGISPKAAAKFNAEVRANRRSWGSKKR